MEPKLKAVVLRDDVEDIAVRIDRAAEVSGLSRRTLYRYGAQGRIRMLKAGRRTLVSYPELCELIASLPVVPMKSAA